MSDRLFYPLVALVVVILILIALLPGRHAAPADSISGAGTDYRQVVISGQDLGRYVGDGRSVQNAGRRSDAQWSLILKSDPGEVSDDPLRAPHFRLAADLEAFFEGARVRVTIRAKTGPNQTRSQFEVNYSTGGQGDSDWQVFEVDSVYRDFQFEWDVPVRTGPAAVDYLAFRPVSEDASVSVEIQKITLERIAALQQSS